MVPFSVGLRLAPVVCGILAFDELGKSVSLLLLAPVDENCFSH